MSHATRRPLTRHLGRLLGVGLLGPVFWGMALLALTHTAAVSTAATADSRSPYGGFEESRPTADNGSPTNHRPAAVLGRSAAVATDLLITKTVTATTVTPGGLITYAISFVSRGGQAEAVRITDTLPPGVVWITDTAQAAGLTRLATDPPVWTLTTLPTDTGGSLLVVVQAPLTATPGTSLVNQATIDAATVDSTPTNNTALAAPVTVTGIDLKLSQHGPTRVPRGATIAYALTLTNTGNLTATQVVVTDSLPSAVSFQAASQGGAWQPDTAQARWTLDNLPPQASATLVITGLVGLTTPPDTMLTNTARVTAAGDVDPTNDVATWTTLAYVPTAASGSLAYSGGLLVGQPITLTATLQDDLGHPVPDGTPVTFIAPPPTTLAPLNATTSGGQATTILQTTRSGSLTVTAASGSVSLSQLLMIAPGLAAQTSLGGPTTAPVGQDATLTAWVSDTYGNAVAPLLVQFSHAGVGQLSATSATTVNGRATTRIASATTGDAFVTATAAGRQAQHTMRFSPLAPAHLKLDLYGTPSSTSPLALYATVRDQFSNTVAAGHNVRFSVVNGTGSLAPTATVTSASGVASTMLQASQAGAITVRAESGVASDQTTLAIPAAPAVRLDLTMSPTGVGVDGGSTEITIRAVDQNGNVDTTRGGNVNLMFATDVTGTLSNAAPLLVNGIARVTLTAPNRYSAAGIDLRANQSPLQEGRLVIPLLTPDVRVDLGTIPFIDPIAGYMTPGQTLTFTVNYANSGQATARGVLVDFAPPGRLTDIQVILPSGVTTLQSPGPSGGGWQWSVGTLGVGQSGQIQVRARLNQAQTWGVNDRVSAAATIQTSTVERVTQAGNNFDPLDISVYSANMTLTIVAPEQVNFGRVPQPNNEEPYGLYPNNQSSLASVTQARITVTLPVSTSFSSFSEIYDNTTRNPIYYTLIDPVTNQPAVSCEGICVWTYAGPSLASTQSNAGIRLWLRISPEARPGVNGLRLPWQITTPIFDANSSDNQGISEANLYGPNFTAQLGSSTSLVPGEISTLAFTARNTGINQSFVDAIASNPTFTLTLPSELEILSTTPPITPSGHTLVWSFQQDYHPNGFVNVAVQVRTPAHLPANINLPYSLVVRASNPEPHLGDNSIVSVLTTIAGQPDRVHQGDETLDIPAGESIQTFAHVQDPNLNYVRNWPVEFLVTPATNPPTLTVNPSQAFTNGAGEAVTTVTAGTTVGEATLTTRINARSQIFTDARQIRIIPNSPFTASVTMSGTVVVGEEKTVTATFTDRYGNAVSDGTVVTLTTNLGGFDVAGRLLTTMTTHTIGGRAQATFLAGTKTGDAPVRVQVCAERACTARFISILPGPAAGLNFGLSRTEVQAGDGPVEVTAYVADEFSNPILTNTVVEFSLSGCPGAILEPTSVPTELGLATATLTPGTQTCQGVVTARVQSLTRTAPIRVVPAAPHTLRLIAPSTLLASGAHTATVRIELTDVYANGISAPVSLSLSPALGSLQPDVVQTVNGQGSTVLTAPRRLGTTQLTAQVGPLTQGATIEFVPGVVQAIALVPGLPVLSVDNQRQSNLVISARDAYSNPVGGAITLSSDLGTTVSPPQGALANGLFIASIAPGTVAGTAHLTVTVAGLTRVFPVRVEAGAPTIIISQTRPSPARLAADGQSTMAITARIMDQHGNLVENGWPVSFTLGLPLGVFTPSQMTTVGGLVTTTLTAGATLGSTQFHIRAGPQRVSRTIEFVPGAPYHVGLALSTSQITGTGEVTATVVLTATIQDRVGHAVTSGTEVVFEVERGVLNGGGTSASTPTDAEGRAYAVLTTPPEPGSIRIIARAGGATGAATLLIGDRPYRLYLPLIWRSP